MLCERVRSCSRCQLLVHLLFFFFNDTPTTEIYTLSLHDALPISYSAPATGCQPGPQRPSRSLRAGDAPSRKDRKSTRLNSSHEWSSYAVFCLKKKRLSISRMFTFAACCGV